MKLPRTWPVCVIDDDPAEYEKLFAVLNQLGVGYVHVSGDRTALPSKPLDSVRLVFLDMHLSGDALSASSAAQTANVFSKSVAVHGAVMLVIVWSKYAEEIDNFRTELYRTCPEYKGCLVFVTMAKPAQAGLIHVAALRAAVRKALKPLLSLRLLWGWEMLAHDAAIRTTSELTALARHRAGDTSALGFGAEREHVLRRLDEILACLVRAEAGLSGSSRSAPGDLLRALGALHEDRVESSRNRRVVADAGKLLAEIPLNGLRAAVSPVERATINSMILMGDPEEDAHLKPGTIYVVKKGQGAVLLGVPVSKILREYCTNAVLLNSSHLKEWLEQCAVILIEITPACDYSQGTRRLARFVGGIVVPEAQGAKCKLGTKENYKSGSYFNLLRVNLKVRTTRPPFSVLPVLSSRLVVTMPLRPKLPNFLRPIGRLRDPALTDVRNWCASESARVGFLCT